MKKLPRKNGHHTFFIFKAFYTKTVLVWNWYQTQNWCLAFWLVAGRNQHHHEALKAGEGGGQSTQPPSTTANKFEHTRVRQQPGPKDQDNTVMFMFEKMRPCLDRVTVFNNEPRSSPSCVSLSAVKACHKLTTNLWCHPVVTTCHSIQFKHPPFSQVKCININYISYFNHFY